MVRFNNLLPFVWMLTATFTVLFFFINGNSYTLRWAKLSRISFRQKLFITAFLIRITWVFISYFLYLNMTGQPFEFEAADSMGYHNEAIWMVEVLKQGQYDVFWSYYATRLSDMGYPAYLTLVYSVFGDSVIWARIIKALLSAITVVLIYKLASRNFGEKTGRIAGILALLYPNLIYYTGLHVKETEMVFILSLFAERADLLLRNKRFSYPQFFLVLLLGASLYFFRAVLAYTLFISFFAVLMFSKKGILRFRRKISSILVAIVLIILFSGSVIITEAVEYWDSRTSNQTLSLEHRQETNKFSKYGSALVFAPVIIIAPLPTFVNIEGQQNHMLLSGGYFVKNIMAFFVIIALLAMLKKKLWQKHVLILSILFTYLAILALSKFAIVERFHMPALPFHIILTAFGITQIIKKNIKYFKVYLLLIAILIFGWNWFKLAGRGIV